METQDAPNRKQVNHEGVRQMTKIELSILIVLGLALVWMDYPLLLGLCVAAPAILGGGEEDERSGKKLHRDKN